MSERMHWIYNLALHTYAPVYEKKNRLSVKNENNFDISSGPLFLLSNHVGTFDPIEISIGMHRLAGRFVHWVSGAYLFKIPFVKWVIGKVCQCIPKQQGRSDFETIRIIKKHFNAGQVVGLFPEGTRSWDGEMMPINYHAVAKMIKSFKVPVLTVSLEGGYAHEPRWAYHRRKGPVTINMRRLITSEEIESLSVDELAEIVRDNLEFSNDNWKQSVAYNYVCNKRAEGLQRTLYLCPKCMGVNTLATQDSEIKCSCCGLKAVLDEKDNLSSKDSDFKTVADWHRWERTQLVNLGELPEEKGRLLQIGNADHGGSLTTISEDISVCIKDKAIRVHCNDFSLMDFVLPLDKITSLILNAKQTMELFCGDKLFRIRLMSSSSSLKFHEYYLAFCALNAENQQ